MIPSWQDLADHLRAEAAEYGRLLGLFEEQQKLLFQRDPQSVLMLGRAIQDQTAILESLRRKRERAVSEFAAGHGRPASATLRSLLDLVPEAAQPLWEALIDEINHLIHRVRRSSRLNYRLLGSVVECHQELLRRLRPDAFTKTYAPDGRVSLAGLTRSPVMGAAS
jgi:flagellar biosynthesis/type III secretory pathway chaperone